MVKTITIKDEVYRALAELKREGESFSDVIMRIINRKAVDLSRFYGVFTDRDLWHKIEEEIIKERRKTLIR